MGTLIVLAALGVGVPIAMAVSRGNECVNSTVMYDGYGEGTVSGHEVCTLRRSQVEGSAYSDLDWETVEVDGKSRPQFGINPDGSGLSDEQLAAKDAEANGAPDNPTVTVNPRHPNDEEALDQQAGEVTETARDLDNLALLTEDGIETGAVGDGVDYEEAHCNAPESLDPGTEFSCGALHPDSGDNIVFIATVVDHFNFTVKYESNSGDEANDFGVDVRQPDCSGNGSNFAPPGCHDEGVWVD